MLRFVVTVCVMSHLAISMPQGPIQYGGAPPPRPVAYGGAPAPAAPSYGPNFSQQLSFGAPPAKPIQTASAAAAPQVRAGIPNNYRPPQPILISQASPSASPATPAQFASFPGASPFGGAGRNILTLKSPQSADEDEYEYEDEEEPQARPSPRPVIPVTRTPIRVASPSPSPAIPFGAVPGRFPVQQQQARQPQRQPIPQNAFPASAAAPVRVPQSAPRPTSQQANYGIDGKRTRLTTPPPIQTVNRYMKQNDDGSITWGYENEDGTFKEETLGSDCVVRGKYGYIDPEGNKREYEYQTGNPCDPNKKDQEEQEEEEDLPDGPSRPQQIAGVINARPRQPQQRRPIGGQLQYQPQQPQYQIS